MLEHIWKLFILQKASTSCTRAQAVLCGAGLQHNNHLHVYSQPDHPVNPWPQLFFQKLSNADYNFENSK